MTESINSTGQRAISTLTSPSGPLTMSSREIADLTGKEHRNVMRDIRVMLAELYGEGGVLSFEHTHRNEQNGQEYPIFRLPKRETLILVSGYDVPLRAKIIDRWQELEARGALPALTREQFIAQALSYQQEIIAEKDAQIAELTPKAGAFDQIANTDGLFTVTTAAKLLGQAPHAFGRMLRTTRWTYHTPGAKHTLAYQDKINAGYLEHKINPYTTRDGEEKTSTQVLFTARGITAMARRLRVPAPDAAALAAAAGDDRPKWIGGLMQAVNREARP